MKGEEAEWRARRQDARVFVAELLAPSPALTVGEQLMLQALAAMWGLVDLLVEQGLITRADAKERADQEHLRLLEALDLARKKSAPLPS